MIYLALAQDALGQKRVVQYQQSPDGIWQQYTGGVEPTPDSSRCYELLLNEEIRGFFAEADGRVIQVRRMDETLIPYGDL